MARTISNDYGINRSFEESLFLGWQHCRSGEEVDERYLCGQVNNETPLTLPPYWDTDEDDDGGPKPSELYGTYTWKIENFSSPIGREVKTEVFDVGGYKWYILVYPQGCDVCNYVSLFLCVGNHEKLLPGWSHFAQFTVTLVNKDPRRSKYSDCLHRFSKKEHDWGWKKFIELSKVQDGFIDADTLEIRVQIQMIREKAHRPFRCLDRQYRRELLVSVYLPDVEKFCRRLVEEKREKIVWLRNYKDRWLRFNTFWLGVDQNTRDCMSREKTDVIMRVVIKHLFVEKEVISTLLMDSLYSGLKALEADSKSKRGKSSLLETLEIPAPFISVEDDMFVLADDALTLLERAALEPLPPKDDKGTQNRTKESDYGEDFNKDAIYQYERRLTELGRKTIETFVLDHIYRKIEVAYQDDVALKIQEELIREWETPGKAEIALKAKSRVSEKEKRSKKKMNKQSRSNHKEKDRKKDEKFDKELQETQQSSLIKERIEVTNSVELAQPMIKKDNAFETVSDVSNVDDNVSETVQLDIKDRLADTSEALPSMELCGNNSSLPLENGNIVTSPSSMDDISLTCSTDSVPSVVINGLCKRSSNTNYRTQNSSSREKKQEAMERHEHLNRSGETNTLLHDPTIFVGNGNAASRSSNSDEPELKAVLSSRDQIQKFEQHMVKKDAFVSSQHIVKEQVNDDRPSKETTAAESLSSPRDPTRNNMPLVQSKSVPNGKIASISVREESATTLSHNDTMEKEAKKEAFRKYLESCGVLDALTKVLVGLYDQNEKPSSAIEFYPQKVGDPTVSEYQKLQVEMSDMQIKYSELLVTHKQTCQELEALKKSSNIYKRNH